MRPSSRPSSLRSLLAACSLAAPVILSGCGMGVSGNAGSTHAVGITLRGQAHGGQQPVAGATVTVYAAGNTGLGSTATALSTTTSDANGNFYFGAANSNTVFCPSTISSGAPTATDTLYVVASGGQPTTGVTNAASVLMAVVGDCRGLENGQGYIYINEGTTVAAMTALQQFYSANSTPSAENFGTTAANTVGLANAAIASSTLNNGVQTIAAPSGADSSVTGATVTITPEVAKLNTMADILAACVNSGGASSSSCTTLFSNVTSATAPTDTLKAAYYMATVPTGVGTAANCATGTAVTTAPSICTLFGLVPASQPYLPVLSGAPTDWTVGVTYGTNSLGTGAGTPYLMNQPEYIAIDGQGDIWIANYASTTAASAITELSPTGAPLKQALNGAFSKASALAIDPFGNVWVSNAGATSLVEYTTGGATNTYTTSIAPYSLTIDGQGNVFEIGKNGTVIQEVPAGNASGTTPTTVTTGLTTTYPALTLDSNYNLWLATATTVDEMLYGSYGTVHGVGSITGLAAPETITVDPSNNVWAGNYSTTAGSLTKIAANNTGSNYSGTTFTDATGLYDNKMVASDSAGNIFTANSHTSSGGVVSFSNSGTVTSPAAGFAHTYYYSQSAAIDASGNVWVGSEETPGTYTPFITEIIGVAAPTITPIAATLPSTPVSPAKSTLPLTLPNAYALYDTAATYTPTVGTVSTSATGTFSLTYGGVTLCSAAGPFASGATITCSIAATTALPANTYTVSAVYTGDATYAPSSTPVTLIVEPSTANGGLITSGMTGYALSAIGTNPKAIVGATATLWATANNGVPTQQTGGEIDGSYYKGQAVALATATTNSSGKFIFGTFGCASPDQLYITVNGGQVNGNANNADILLISALGPCNSTTTALGPFVDEVTTVAAAYTLAPFMSIVKETPSSGSAYYDVNITSSATNYATATQSIGTIYHPVGLQHAFLNAANLASVVTGAAQSSLSGYSGTVVPILPTALIDSVANVITACVQTVGNCTNIFAGALPLTTGTATAPTNTLAALLNVARNPFMGGGGAAATWLNLASGGPSPYSPTLTVTGAGTTAALPHDLTAAIFYPASLSGNLINKSSTLDANDNYYLLSEDSTSGPYYEIIGNESNGANMYTHQFCQTTPYAQSTCAEYIGSLQIPYAISADQSGHIWMSVNGTTTTPAAGSAFVSTQSDLVQVNASTGTWTNYPANTSTQVSTFIAPAYAGYGLAIDQNGSVWLGTSTATLFGPVYLYTSTNLANDTEGPIMGYCQGYSYDLQFDGQGNLFCSGYYSSTTYKNYVEVIPNQSLTSSNYPAVAAGAYAQSYSQQTSSGSIDVYESVGGIQTTYGIGLAFDSAGNVYQGAGTSPTAGGTGDGLYVVTKNYNTTNPANPYVSSLSISSSLIDGAAISTTNGLVNIQMIRPEFITQDGMGAIWVPDTYQDTIIRVYGTSGTSVMAYYPCVGSTCYTLSGTTSYPSTATGLYGARQAFVDSTGTVYVMAYSSSTSTPTASSGTWAQIFGVGVPEFPLSAAEHPAQMP